MDLCATTSSIKRVGASRENESMRIFEIVAGGRAYYSEKTQSEIYQEIIKETKILDSRNRTNEVINDLDPAADINMRGHGATSFLRRRDLRWLESSSQYEPTIIVRRHVTLIVLDPIRAFVTSRKVTLIVLDGSDSLLANFESHMNDWFPEETSDGVKVQVPFELHAYDAIFTTVKIFQAQKHERMKHTCKRILKLIQQKGSLLPLSLQEEMRDSKMNASELVGTVELYRRAIYEVIVNDDQMALMNLSKLERNPLLYRTPLCPEILSAHEEIEELLQTYATDYDNLSTKLKFLRARLQNAEDLVSLRLDISRNQLLVANTAFSLLACCISVGAYITGIFGMNLDNTATILPQTGSFAMVWSGSTAAIVLMFVVVYWYLIWKGIIPQSISLRTTTDKSY